MRGFYADNKEVFKLVEKRENLWNRLQDYEVQQLVVHNSLISIELTL